MFLDATMKHSKYTTDTRRTHICMNSISVTEVASGLAARTCRPIISDCIVVSNCKKREKIH